MSITKRRIAAVSGIVFAAFVVAFAHSAYGRPSRAQTIVPGQRIGSLELKSYRGKLPLGKPDAFDAGMSHYHYLWISKSHEHHGVRTYTTFAAAVSNGPIDGSSGQTIESIRITSPFFHTTNGVSVGASLATVKRRFRRLNSDPNRSNILVDSNAGIAFEYTAPHPAASSRCVAITVFKPRNPQIFDADQVRDLIPKHA